MLAELLALSFAVGAADDPALARLLHKLANLPPGIERTVRATDLLVGKPYLKGPLGEGFGPDPNPRFRLDGFDCQTFVETALALGEGTTEAEVRAAMDDVRYADRPAFAGRNHYMMSQWVPNNVAKGYVGPIPVTSHAAEKIITAKSWAARWPRDIVLPAARIPLGTFTLPLTDFETLAAEAKDIPNGTLMLIVREDRPAFPDRVTHLGFVIQSPNGTFFRHASDTFERIVDEPLDHFITRNRRYAYTVSGVALIPLRANRARVAQLKLPRNPPTAKAATPAE